MSSQFSSYIPHLFLSLLRFHHSKSEESTSHRAVPASSSSSVAIMRTSCAVNKTPSHLAVLHPRTLSPATQECHNAASLRMCLADAAFLLARGVRIVRVVLRQRAPSSQSTAYNDLKKTYRKGDANCTRQRKLFLEVVTAIRERNSRRRLVKLSRKIKKTRIKVQLRNYKNVC